MNNDIEKDKGLLGTIWGSNLNANLFAIIETILIKNNETIVTYSFLDENDLINCTMGKFVSMFTKIDIQDVEIGSNWKLKSDRDIDVKVIGYCQSSVGLIVKTNKKVKINSNDYADFEISFFKHTFNKIGNGINQISYQNNIYYKPIDETKIENEGDLLLKSQDKAVCSYWFIAFDYLKPGKRGYGKGNTFIVLEDSMAFNITSAEKVISKDLKKKGIKNKGVCISNWMQSNEQVYLNNTKD